MSQTRITLTLPDKLASEAKAVGLLKPEVIELLLREELRRRRIDNLFQAADKLANLSVPALTKAEIEAEIEVARSARRTSHASNRPFSAARKLLTSTHHILILTS